jgi:capsular polysaccharide biosynthesis protein
MDACFVERLRIVRELGFNLDKALRLQKMRGRLRERYGSKPGVVYIARGPSGKQRSPLNEAELIDFLEARGVRIIHPEIGGDFMIGQTMDADVVITVEGSQACHAIYALRQGGSLLILQPPDRFYNPHVEWTRLLGMRYGIVIGIPQADTFRIEADEVWSMLELLSTS